MAKTLLRDRFVGKMRAQYYRIYGIPTPTLQEELPHIEDVINGRPYSAEQFIEGARIERLKCLQQQRTHPGSLYDPEQNGRDWNPITPNPLKHPFAWIAHIQNQMHLKEQQKRVARLSRIREVNYRGTSRKLD